jgi:hypothetical protein
VVFQLSSASYVVCLAGCLRCSCINNGCDKLDENGREIHFFDSHSKYVHPLSRKGKAGTFLCEYGDSSLQYSFGQEKSSDQSLSERNVEAETNSNTKSSPHSEDQCHDFGVEGLINKNNQIEGSMLDTCSRGSLDNDQLEIYF